jgi:hypothetical protein
MILKSNLLTEMLEGRIFPGEPTSGLSVSWMSQEHSVCCRRVVGSNQAPATKVFFPFSYFVMPCNHRTL